MTKSIKDKQTNLFFATYFAEYNTINKLVQSKDDLNLIIIFGIYTE